MTAAHHIGFLALFVLQLADVWFTTALLETGRFVEANPIVATLVEHNGWFGALAVKIALAAVLYLLVAGFRPQHARLVLFMTLPAYVTVVGYQLMEVVS